MTTDPGTLLLTGPTGGLGRSTVLALARRPPAARPDLLLVGRAGDALRNVSDAARAEGATVRTVPTDLARLADVRAASEQVAALLSDGAIRPLRTIVANAGVSPVDTRRVSADGYELTFAVNHLAHAQLVGDLLPTLAEPARVVLLGSNTYHQNRVRRLLGVPAAHWRDPIELARPAAPDAEVSPYSGGVAYSDSKLAILYWAHELQRHAPHGVAVIVFEPGFMPGTGLSRQHGEHLQRLGRALERLPGISTPGRSGPMLASVALDERWSRLRDGAFVVKDVIREVEPVAIDRDRERRLWDVTAELLAAAAART